MDSNIRPDKASAVSYGAHYHVAAEVMDQVVDVVSADDAGGDDVDDVDECCAECVAVVAAADDEAADGHGKAAIVDHRLSSD